MIEYFFGRGWTIPSRCAEYSTQMELKEKYCVSKCHGNFFFARKPTAYLCLYIYVYIGSAYIM